MARESDLFANFERMRREMDELFGDVVDRRLTPQRRRGFSPPVDVFYENDPPRAVVAVELAGIDPGDVEIEVRGREVTVTGNRRAMPASEDRLYQQIEIERGPFRRVVTLGVDVDQDATRATYEQGILRVELPLERPAPGGRSVPILTPDRPA